MLTPHQPSTEYANPANVWPVADTRKSAPRNAGARNNVRALRTARRLTQPQLAERSGLSQQQISKIESGKIQPKGYQITALARALGATADEVLGTAAGDAPLGAGMEAVLADIAEDFRLEVGDLLRPRDGLSREDRLKLLSDVRELFREYAGKLMRGDRKS